jgi:hypothetical protein
MPAVIIKELRADSTPFGLLRAKSGLDLFWVVRPLLGCPLRNRATQYPSDVSIRLTGSEAILYGLATQVF